MTPCEELGYKVGDWFRKLYTDSIPKGTKVQLIKDDGSNVPLFRLPTGKSVYLWAEDVVPLADTVELKAITQTHEDIKTLKSVMAANPSTVLSLEPEVLELALSKEDTKHLIDKLRQGVITGSSCLEGSTLHLTVLNTTPVKVTNIELKLDIS